MPRTVLVVDHIDLNRQDARRLLEVGGYEVMEAASFVQAQSIMRSQHPDLMLVADMQGSVEVIERLHASFPSVPLIAVVRQDQPGVALAALRAGALDVVTRPATERMLDEVARRLRRRRS